MLCTGNLATNERVALFLMDYPRQWELLIGHRKSFRGIPPTMFARRVVMHPAESPRKIKLLGESELITDLLDRQVAAVEQLDGVLHPQMIQVTARPVTRYPLEQCCVV